jgi:PAS domain S-box-containing protein
LRQREEQYRNLVENMNDGLVSVNLEGRITFANSRLCDMLGYSPEEIVGHRVLDFFDEANREIAREQLLRRRKGERQPYEIALTKKNGEQLFAFISPMPIFDSGGRFQSSISVITDLSDRKRTAERAQKHLNSLNLLMTGVEHLAKIRDSDAMVREICQLVVSAFDAQLVWLGWADPSGVVRPLYWTGPKGDYLQEIEVRWDDSPLGRGPSGRALREGVPVVLKDLEQEASFTPWQDAARECGFRSAAAIPLSNEERTFASLNIYADRPHFFTPERIELMQAFARIAAAALENTRLLAKVEKHVKELEALREIDLAISGSLDLRLTMNVLLDRLMALLKVDAATVQLLNPHSLVVEFAASRGFRSPSMAQGRILLGQGLRGRIALERVPLYIPDLGAVREQAIRASWLGKEKFVSYYGFPLVNKGQVRGVMEIFHRSSFQVDEELRGFLEALAGQAAIAIDNATLFQEMERSHQELSLAYEATLEGWAKALELRDLETKGHCQRVTEMTLELARHLGIPEKDLVHVYRGALLHDIGKLAIPDAILLKKGPFTAEEWEVMRQHPVYAYQLLSGILYLRPALDIPYGHHERWDGSGYPQGLQGEEIPLAARIFAVVDVWDALGCNRPYRPAWTQDQIILYLRAQAGKLFDRQVVEVFLDEVLPKNHATTCAAV